jgi:hypothetical protein
MSPNRRWRANVKVYKGIFAREIQGGTWKKKRKRRNNLRK